MRSESLRRLIERVVDEVLAEHRAAGDKTPAPRPTVLLTGTTEGLEVALHQIKRLEEELGPLRAVVSETFCEFVSPESLTHDTGIAEVITSLTAADAESVASGTSALVVASLSVNSLAKMALGLADSTAACLWQAARLAGIPLIVAEPVRPLVESSRPDVSPFRAQQREERLSALRADGAEVIRGCEIFAHVQRRLREQGDPVAAKRARLRGPRPIVTVEDVERAHRRGLKTWGVEDNAIVTAAAWDRARDLGMEMSGGNLP
jgi:hypothetical protein